jgi:hypothetical protein
MSTRKGGTMRMSRLFVLGAVLIGLFLMHGAPTSMEFGCHDGMAKGGISVEKSMGPMTCVGTIVRDVVELAAPGLVGFFLLEALLMLVSLASVPRFGGRGPPRSGRDVLLDVCIART